ncbi:MAG TPA: hypothetical protein VFS75_01400 [Candidatus Paceibacterota bacterium]|nr:hypothetical protein [Candidatus Paceibacterota bacterium]
MFRNAVLVLNESIVACESSEPYRCVECEQRFLAGEEHLVVERLVLSAITGRVGTMVNVICHSCDADWRRILEVEFRIASTRRQRQYGLLRKRVVDACGKGGYVKDEEADMFLRWRHGTVERERAL